MDSMPEIHAVAVFCGSRTGNDPAYRAAAQTLGHGLAEAGIRLVYGGGRIGLMGVMADAALAAGGTVLGVIPEFLTRREVMHEGISELVITASMHARKQKMFEAADAFISLPGGLGTLDETIEIITWRQLGLHTKPVLICDVAGSAAPFLATIEAAIAAEFAYPGTRELYEVVDGVPALLRQLAHLHRGVRGEAARL
ncbi:MAG TPA: TIGR00730 family Rossman fold protein [Acetobacteraceae bacterium]|nr:TIGR00730 family Rossman fold protein [Acetobacteraceae bacterium]